MFLNDTQTFTIEPPIGKSVTLCPLFQFFVLCPKLSNKNTIQCRPTKFSVDNWAVFTHVPFLWETRLEQCICNYFVLLISPSILPSFLPPSLPSILFLIYCWTSDMMIWMYCHILLNFLSLFTLWL